MSAKRRDKSKKSHETVNPPESFSVAQSSSSRKNQVYDKVNFGLDALGNISEGSDVLAPLKAACRTTKSVLDIMQAIESNQEEWTNLTQRLKGYMSGLEKQTTLFEAYAANDRAFDEALRQPLMHYFKALEDIHDTVVEVREKRSRSKLGFLKSMSKVKIDAGEIRELNRDIEDGHRHFMEALGIFTALRTQGIERKIETATILRLLPTVAFAASSVHTTCLKRTREAVLQMIWRWASEPGPQVYSRNVRSRIMAERRSVRVDSSSPRQTTTHRPRTSSVRPSQETLSIISLISDPTLPKLWNRTLLSCEVLWMSNFRTLITNPLLQSGKRVILVIDAIDECKSGSQRRTSRGACYRCSRVANLKIFLTSRPDPVIEAVLQDF
ncbi:SubName: Full=Related to vegetatible incompatibility protein HET-E-1 {ECO:0000313/EMBL:CCA75380.1} [Serendipita indica DSM 11827]|nr:SubName: Full=Related to vegetatible incompatibility protein HET-E-1 {ECO:0000313/EMBL:CCA75380.1} [Serendipita indica DSM 11827]